MHSRAQAWYGRRTSDWRDYPAEVLLTGKRRAGPVIPARDRARDIRPEFGSYPGKGEALWKSLLVTKGDLLVFVDADLTQWGRISSPACSRIPA